MHLAVFFRFVGGLQETEYYFKVAGVNLVGQGPYGEPVMVRTSICFCSSRFSQFVGAIGSLRPLKSHEKVMGSASQK